MPLPTKRNNETKNEFISRCMVDEKTKSEFPDSIQRLAVCSEQYNLATQKISFDYDGTFSTLKGLELATKLKDEGATIYIISARESRTNMLPRANKAGILFSRIFATGSNEAKIQKVKDLRIEIHYDNNENVVSELPNIGRLFKND
jgi:hypothetical protein